MHAHAYVLLAHNQNHSIQKNEEIGNSIGNSALYCSKIFKGNSQLSWKRKGDNY